MKKVLVAILLVMCNISIGQTIFTVNTSAMGVDGGTVGSLDKMIENGLLSAAAGNNVIINLKVPDLGGDFKELIPLSEPLPTINNTTGSIVIQKDPTTATIQGVELVYPGLWGGSPSFGFYMHEASNVQVLNLYFENFINGDDISSNGLKILNSQSVKVLGSHFNNNSWALNAVDSDILIENNNFSDNHDAILWSTLDTYTNPVTSVKINQNIIDGPTFTGDRGVRIFFHEIKNTLFEITNNTITNCAKGIGIVNNVYLGQNVNLNIINNQIEHGISALELIGPRPNWKVEGNVLNDISFGIITGNFFSPPINDYSIDFIESNSFGEGLYNTGNLITNCHISFYVNNENEVNIIGYNVDGKILIKKFYPTVIRENLITTSTIPGLLSPIHLDSGGNAEFDPITLNIAFHYDPILLVNYTIAGTSPLNSDFLVEFFESNSEGDLLSYIGNQSISSDGTYEAEFTGAEFTFGDRVGVTITSLGNVGGTKLGTSEVEYIGTDPFPCDTCNSFKPLAGSDYWISGWVNVETLGQVKTFQNDVSGPSLELGYFGSVAPPNVFQPTGEIIDGWQRIVGKFRIPDETLDLRLELNADGNFPTNFDDIRIHPFNGSMKSYVYDGETFWLTSELDDNNYATFYEYDQEGGLIRIKKETAKGIVTIQTTRSNTIKN